jgi:phospholipase/carboxylesterase
MKATETRDGVTLEPDRAADAAVIWLHGLGADGHDFVPIVGELELPRAHGIRFIFPHAPVRPVTLNGGMPMRAWYDIFGLGRLEVQDEGGIRDSERSVRALIQAQLDGGIAAARIVIAGFSQGGAIALHTGLRYPQRLAGILALSTYLPLAERLPTEIGSANREVPILMCHGRLDPMLPYSMGEASRAQLEAHGCKLEWRDYLMQHEVCLEEIEEIGRWLGARLP